MDLVFSAGSSKGAMQCINVTIIDSPIMELVAYEAFTVTLTTSVVALGNNVTTVTITDTNGMCSLIFFTIVMQL